MPTMCTPIKDVSFIIATLEPHPPILEVVEQLSRSDPSTEVVVTSQIGKARSRNQAVYRTHNKYLVFLDGDIRCDPNEIMRVLEQVYRNPNLFFCFPHGTHGFCCSRILVIQRELFLKLGGFNETFDEPMDVEFGLRAERSNVTMRYVSPISFRDYGPSHSSTFVDDVRRPYQHMRLLMLYPKAYWTIKSKRSLKQFLWSVFVKQKHSFGEHYGVLNLVQVVKTCLFMLTAMVLTLLGHHQHHSEVMT